MLAGMFGGPSEHSVLEARLKDARKKLDESKQRLEREKQQRAEAEEQHDQHKKNSASLEGRMKKIGISFSFASAVYAFLPPTPSWREKSKSCS